MRSRQIMAIEPRAAAWVRAACFVGMLAAWLPSSTAETVQCPVNLPCAYELTATDPVQWGSWSESISLCTAYYGAGNSGWYCRPRADFVACQMNMRYEVLRPMPPDPDYVVLTGLNKMASCSNYCPPGSVWSTVTGSCLPSGNTDSPPPPSCDRSKTCCASKPGYGNPIYPTMGSKGELVDMGLELGGLRYALKYDSEKTVPTTAVVSGVPVPADPPSYSTL